MKITLVKGLSYSYRNLLATTKNPTITCSEADAKYLCSTGFFKEMVDDTTMFDNDLSKMSVAELENIAVSKNVDIKGLKKKEIIEKLSLANENISDDNTGFNLEPEQ